MTTPAPPSHQTAPADVARFREIASSIVSDMDEPSHFREVYITRITAALAAQRAAGMEWQPIETAPKDGTEILLFAVQRPHAELNRLGKIVLSGYWDRLDAAWCSTGSTWTGPFYDPTQWMPLPPPAPIRALLSGDKPQGSGEE